MSLIIRSWLKLSALLVRKLSCCQTVSLNQRTLYTTTRSQHYTGKNYLNYGPSVHTISSYYSRVWLVWYSWVVLQIKLALHVNPVQGLSIEICWYTLSTSISKDYISIKRNPTRSTFVYGNLICVELTKANMCELW